MSPPVEPLKPSFNPNSLDRSFFRNCLREWVVLAGLGSGMAALSGQVAAEEITNTAPPELKRTPANIHVTANRATGRLKRLGEGFCELELATAVLVETPRALEGLVPADSVLMLTAGHVVRNPSCKHSYEIDFFHDHGKGMPLEENRITLKARLIAYSAALGLSDDLALLVARLPEEPAHREEISKRRVLISERIDPIERFEPLVSVGFPAGKRDIHQHYLLTLNEGVSVLTRMVLKGHSGAGVFDKFGKLRGIVSGSHVHTDPHPDFPIPEADKIVVEGPTYSDPEKKAAEAKRRAAVLIAKTRDVITKLVPREIREDNNRTIVSNVAAVQAIFTKVEDEFRNASAEFGAAVKRQEQLWGRLITKTTSEETKAMLAGQLRLALTQEAEVLFDDVGGIPPQFQDRIGELHK